MHSDSSCDTQELEFLQDISQNFLNPSHDAPGDETSEWNAESTKSSEANNVKSALVQPDSLQRL